MKALTMTLVAALTLLATTSQATLKVLPCGRIYNDQSVSRANEKGVLNASNSAQYRISPTGSHTDPVNSQN